MMNKSCRFVVTMLLISIALIVVYLSVVETVIAQTTPPTIFAVSPSQIYNYEPTIISITTNFGGGGSVVMPLQIMLNDIPLTGISVSFSDENIVIHTTIPANFPPDIYTVTVSTSTESASLTNGLTVLADMIAPTVEGLNINGDAISSAVVSVTLMMSASDLQTGIALMSFSNDQSIWSDWLPYTTTNHWRLPVVDGLKTVYGRFTDKAGNISEIISDTITLDTTVPAEYGVSINNGVLYTNRTAVTLTVGARVNTAQMMVSNDGGFSGVQWEPYASHKTWTITQYGDYVIPRVVYIRYKDVAGNVSATFQDDVILDVTAPTGSIRVIPNTVSRNLKKADLPTVTLQLSALDDVSGVGFMRLSSIPTFIDTEWQTYTTSYVWPAGEAPNVHVQYRDNANNVSSTYSASVSGFTYIYLPLVMR